MNNQEPKPIGFQLDQFGQYHILYDNGVILQCEMETVDEHTVKLNIRQHTVVPKLVIKEKK